MRTILVTGANRGIGLEFVRQYSSDGDHVIAICRNDKDIDELKAIGCDSAKSVLEIGKEDLVKRTDLEEETVDEIVKILSSEFEK